MEDVLWLIEMCYKGAFGGVDSDWLTTQHR
jgi:hypothetical protein